jgi:hypothetical protein
MWRNGRRNGLKIRWAVKGPCRFESGHRQFQLRIMDFGLRKAHCEAENRYLKRIVPEIAPIDENSL